MHTTGTALQDLARHLRFEDPNSSEQARQALERCLVVLVRSARVRNLGTPAVVRWVRRQLQSLNPDEVPETAVDRVLSRKLFQHLASKPSTTLSNLETVVGP